MKPHKYRLPVRADSLLDEIVLVNRVSLLIISCYRLSGRLQGSVEMANDVYRFLTEKYQQLLDLGTHPMRLFVLAQLERDLRECKKWLISEIPTEWERDVSLFLTLPTFELANQGTEPKLMAL